MSADPRPGAPQTTQEVLVRFRPTRRQLLGGAIGLGALGLVGTTTRPAAASLLLDDDPVQAYEIAWSRVDTTVTDNEAGSLAWGMSYTLLSLVRLYQATKDATHLDRFVERADQVWEQTDKARGVVDWKGDSGQVWRAAGSYTAATATMLDADGAELFEVRYASSDPEAATATVANVSDTTFDLTLDHPDTGTVELTGLTVDPSAATDVVAQVNAKAYQESARWTAKRLDGAAGDVPVAGTTDAVSNFYAFPVHTGMITYPIALFSRLVTQEGLTAHQASADRYLDLLEEALACHDADWQPSGNGGDYVLPKGAPLSFDGTTLPFNQSHALGAAHAELHRVRPSAAHADKVVAMVDSFTADAIVDGDAWSWRYWPSYSENGTGYTAEDGVSEYTPSFEPNEVIEDVSHAALTVEFMIAAHRAELGATEAHARRLAANYVDNVRDGATAVHLRVNGTGDGNESYATQAGRWLPVAAWDDAAATHVTSVYEAVSAEPTGGAHLLGIAYLAWAAQAGWELD